MPYYPFKQSARKTHTSKSAYLNHEKIYNSKIKDSYSRNQYEKLHCKTGNKQTTDSKHSNHEPRQYPLNALYYSRKIDYIRYSKTGDCNLVDRDRQINDRSISSADKHFYLTNCHRIHNHDTGSNAKSYNEFYIADPKFTTL